jgi:hypothetical protein
MESNVTPTPLFPVSPLERVREGMEVVDEHGQRLGTVGRVRLGYPEAVTPDDGSGVFKGVGLIVAPIENTGGTTAYGAATPFLITDREFNSVDLPDELREELQRTGYIELAERSLRGPARYAHGDWISEVSGNSVRIRRPHT